MDEVFRELFVEEATPLTAEIEAHLLDLERSAAAIGDRWRALLGALHTLKGNCGMVGLDQAADVLHVMEQRAREVRVWPTDRQGTAIAALVQVADRLRETLLGPQPDAALGEERVRLAAEVPAEVETAIEPESRAREPAAAHIRIPSSRLDRLLETTADLGASSERLRAIVRTTRRRDALELADGAARRLADVRAQVMDLRLVPLSDVLVRFDRAVRDLARATDKRVTLAVTGGEVNVDKHVAEQVAEPLLHVVRNAVDHGIESPRERSHAGKAESGVVSIDARAAGGMLHVLVADDGRGIDVDRLTAAAAARGIDVAAWPADQRLELIFAPEVSTADRVTTISGRGIGLDQARRALERIGGSIRVDSEVGSGTRFHLRLPLVVAVQRSLLVRCGSEVYGIPFTSVIEVVRVAPTGIPACVLAEELGTRRAQTPPAWIVVERSDAPLAVLVDGVIGHQELTIRELDPLFGRPRGVTGAALLADGQIVPVLEFETLGRARSAA
jgi:two-component system chemotaxis sensor kinase CheA